MPFWKRAGLLAAALLLPATQLSAQAARPCIARQQVSDMTVALLPPLIDKARSTCAGRLPATAFLSGEASKAMATRFQAAATLRTASAAQGFRLMSDQKLPDGISDATVVTMMAEMLPSMAFKDGKADVCGNLNDLIEALAPLSPDQTGKLVTAFFVMAGVQSPSICKS
jgi:hypothetical protein